LGPLFNIGYLIGSVWVELFEGRTAPQRRDLLPRAARGDGSDVDVLGSAGGAVRHLPVHAGA
jgi:hypothetical protein